VSELTDRVQRFPSVCLCSFTFTKIDGG